jgi:hypothetical protein
MNLTQLTAYVRDLSGVYSTDVVSDSLITSWINEVNYDIGRKTFGASGNVPTLVTGSQVPWMALEFRSILAYGAAVKVLNFVSDDTRRVEMYTGEYNNLLPEVISYYTSGISPGSYTEAGGLMARARDLTRLYDRDIFTDEILFKWLDEAQKELVDYTTWPWVGPNTVPIVGHFSIPSFDIRFWQILSYRVAIRMLTVMADTSGRIEQFTAEYGSILSDMEEFYLTANGTGDTTGAPAMIRLVRDLTGVYSKRVMRDEMILFHLNNAYNELSARHDWNWLESNYEIPLPAPVSGAHNLVLPNGTRRVMEAYIVFPSGHVREMVNTPNLARIELNDSGIYYDVDFSGNVVIRPVQDSGPATVKFRYLGRSASLVDEDSVPLFDSSFWMILPYRAAITILLQLNPEDKRIPGYETQFTSLYENMYTMYELVHDNRGFQMGEDGVQTRRYYPWFRPA